MKKLVPIASLLLLVSFAFSGCDTPGESAGAGAAAGALIGAAAGGRPIDVLNGAAIGAGTGYVVGKIAQHERREEEGYYDDQYQGDNRYRDDRGYPVGQPSRRPGFVFSPYPPHNRIDVRGIPSGAKVLDPSVNRVFINP